MIRSNSRGGYWTLSDLRGRWWYPEAVLVDGRRFRKAKWQEPKPGVVAQYREAVETNSRHLLVLSNGEWLVSHIDDVNPDMGDASAPIRHFVADHSAGMAVVSIVAILAGAALIAAVMEA